jgi:PAS domain S-box-containing protein
MGRKHRPSGLGSEASRRLAPTPTTPHSVGPTSSGSPSKAAERRGVASSAKTSAARPGDWLGLAFDASRDPLFVFDAEQCLLDCNRSACRLLARGKDELIARTFVELCQWLAEASHGMLCLASRAATDVWQLHGVEPVESQSVARSPGGQSAEAAILDPNAERARLTEQTALDAASRNATFNELTGADPLVRNVIEGLPVGVWVIDLMGDVVVANSAGRRIWGDSRNDWRRDGWWVASGEKIAQDQWPGPRVLATGEAAPPTEVEVLTFDQVRKTLLISATPLRNEQGRLLGAVCIHQDITSRVTAERATQLEIQRNVHLERLASIGTLAAGIAHEINNPLGTILLSAELGLASLPTDNQEQRRSLTSIVADAKRCGRIVHNVLRFASRLATDRSPGDLNSVVRGVHQRIAEHAWQRGVTVLVELTDRLPAVIIDAAAMEQAIMNVIRNAVDVSADTTEARVEIRTQALSTAVRLTVRDYGPGVSARDLPHLFDPFYTTRRNLGGIGLGLSVAHGIVRDHDGTLRIESTPGEGATIYLDLPIASSLDSGGNEPTHEQHGDANS